MLQDMQGRSQSFPLTEGGVETRAVMTVMLLAEGSTGHRVMSSVRSIENVWEPVILADTLVAKIS